MLAALPGFRGECSLTHFACRGRADTILSHVPLGKLLMLRHAHEGALEQFSSYLATGGSLEEEALSVSGLGLRDPGARSAADSGHAKVAPDALLVQLSPVPTCATLSPAVASGTRPQRALRLEPCYLTWHHTCLSVGPEVPMAQSSLSNLLGRAWAVGAFIATAHCGVETLPTPTDTGGSAGAVNMGSGGSATGGVPSGSGGGGGTISVVPCGNVTCGQNQYCRAGCYGTGGSYSIRDPSTCWPVPAACTGNPTCQCICGSSACGCSGTGEIVPACPT
jgi:hypothetical protein